MHTIIFITVQNLCHSHTSFIMGQLNTLLLITWIVLALFWLVSLHFCNGNITNAVLLTENSMFMHAFIWGSKMMNILEYKEFQRWMNWSKIKRYRITTLELDFVLSLCQLCHMNPCHTITPSFILFYCILMLFKDYSKIICCLQVMFTSQTSTLLPWPRTIS